MRGRVMALYSIVFLGSTPIGGPLAGWLAETWSPRVALWSERVAALIAAVGRPRRVRPSRAGYVASPTGQLTPVPPRPQ